MSLARLAASLLLRVIDVGETARGPIRLTAPAVRKTLRTTGQRGFDPFEPLIHLPKLLRRRRVAA